MKITRAALAAVSLLLTWAMVLNMTGCAARARATDLMAGVTAAKVTVSDDLASQNAAVTDFAVRLLQASAENGKNTLISPLSVLYALAMTANGAENETREQMETVLGMPTEKLNEYLYGYLSSLPGDGSGRLSLANSLWLREDERFTVNPGFLQTNASYYGAGIYKAPFDSQTCREINDWVKENTHGMIPAILDAIPSEGVMYLVNALAFEAEWTEAYRESQVRRGKFTREDGVRQDIALMHSTEYAYLEDEKATGFLKYYKGGGYAFAALLPNEGVSVSEYIASLDGEALHALLADPAQPAVNVAIPKFETDYHAEMSDILSEMGMPRAFDIDEAEFGGLGTFEGGNIWIGRVMHKTFLSVGEQGTRAGAATAVEVQAGGAEPSEEKEVCLDRPFVYLLIDCKNSIPLFMGTMMDMG